MPHRAGALLVEAIFFEEVVENIVWHIANDDPERGGSRSQAGERGRARLGTAAYRVKLVPFSSAFASRVLGSAPHLPERSISSCDQTPGPVRGRARCIHWGEAGDAAPDRK